jgi:IS5 family transposase
MSRPKQMTVATEADTGFERHRKATRHDIFLAEMDKLVAWDRLCAVVEPYYPKESARGGRQPIGLERMLRIHLLQQWYALSDPAAAGTWYDAQARRRFVGIDLAR